MKSIINLIKNKINKKRDFKIILVRHGESEGNVDPNKYMIFHDHKIKLTDNGVKQAINAGKEIKKIIKNDPLNVYVSPYIRTKETWEGIKKGLNRNNITLEFDPRIREQEHKIFKTKEQRTNIFKEQKKFSKFFYRFGNGESGADVHSRVCSFLNELAIKRVVFKERKDYLIVSHAITLSSMLMKFLNLSIDEFDQLIQPEKCSPIVLKTKDFKKVELDLDNTFGNKELLRMLINNK